MEIVKLKELQSQFAGNEPLAIVIQYLIEEKEGTQDARSSEDNSDATTDNANKLDSSG